VRGLFQRGIAVSVGIQGSNININTMKIVARTCFFNNVPDVVLSQLASTTTPATTIPQRIVSVNATSSRKTIVENKQKGPLSTAHQDRAFFNLSIVTRNEHRRGSSTIANKQQQLE
jgi:hypothetical protein